MGLSTDSTLRIAIVGSGPSGFYAAESLLRSEHAVAVDVYEKLPVPYGLVRFGVAPDHPKLKMVANVFDRIAQMDGFRFIGNVCIGKDVSVETLSQHYHAIIFACGAESERNMGIPGESLQGSHSAREFVAWYNGHPEYRHLDFDFSHERAVVIGQGNVALDVARILSKTTDELRNTDIAEHALEALAESKIKHIHIVGRRGPVQAKFTDKELREFGELSNCTPVVKTDDLQFNAASKKELEGAGSANINSNINLLQAFNQQVSEQHDRNCHFEFFQSPVAIGGSNHVENITFERTALSGNAFKQKAVSTGKKVNLDCGLVFRCIGYRAVQIPGLNYDENSGVLSNREGRLLSNDKVITGLYATGWVKRGPSGTIGSNRGDSVATVEAILSDMPKLLSQEKSSIDELLSVLNKQGCKFVNYADWKKIDAAEIARGKSEGKPRIKFTSVPEMLNVLH